MGSVRFCIVLLSIGVLGAVWSVAQADAAYVGVVYGYSGDGPSPDVVVQLLRANGIFQVRLYDTNPLVLSAFSNTSLEVVVGITNQELPSVGASNITAAAWVTSKLLPFTPWLNITGIAVGSEVLTSGSGNLSSMLVPAMRYVQSALVSAGLDSQIKVSTTHNILILDNSFPPSQGSFNSSYLPVLVPLLNFLSLTNSYFMVNLYPYYSYQANSVAIPLTYALFESNAGIVDSSTGDHYYSLYDALLDACYSALNAQNVSKLPIVVSETGWPSAGDSDEPGATIPNAEAYNGNLATRVFNGTATPLKPYEVADVYIYELFNEESRSGPLSERNWGLFNANSTPVYAIDLTGSGRIVDGNTTNATWCVARDGVAPGALQNALNYACGQGAANCTAIQNNGPCWLPDTLESHASYAMNAYFQKEGDVDASCSFQGLGMVTYVDPSYNGCEYLLNTSALASSLNPGGTSTSNGEHVFRRGDGFVANILVITVLVLVVSTSPFFLHR